LGELGRCREDAERGEVGLRTENRRRWSIYGGIVHPIEHIQHPLTPAPTIDLALKCVACGCIIVIAIDNLIGQCLL